MAIETISGLLIGLNLTPVLVEAALEWRGSQALGQPDKAEAARRCATGFRSTLPEVLATVAGRLGATFPDHTAR